MIPRIVILPLALVTGSQRGIRGDTPYDGFNLVDAAGNIRKPADCRDRYQILGTYTVLEPNSMVNDAAKPNGDEMHCDGL